jgi:hypothetical protein
MDTDLWMNIDRWVDQMMDGWMDGWKYGYHNISTTVKCPVR